MQEDGYSEKTRSSIVKSNISLLSIVQDGIRRGDIQVQLASQPKDIQHTPKSGDEDQDDDSLTHSLTHSQVKTMSPFTSICTDDSTSMAYLYGTIYLHRN